jgi:hypothetical protein
MKRVLHLFLVILLLVPIEFSLISTANASKTGGTCKLVNAKGMDGKKPIVCKKNKFGKLVWTASQKSTSTTIEYNLSISLTENNETNFTSDTDNIGFCNNGGARYKDIAANTRVEIRDGSGNLLATGALGSAHVVYLGGLMANCIFNPIINLKKSDFYQVKIGNRYNASYSFTELVNEKWKLELSLG